MISIINCITAYVYYILQNLLVRWRFLIEFKKYEDELEDINIIDPHTVMSSFNFLYLL